MGSVQGGGKNGKRWCETVDAEITEFYVLHPLWKKHRQRVNSDIMEGHLEKVRADYDHYIGICKDFEDTLDAELVKRVDDAVRNMNIFLAEGTIMLNLKTEIGGTLRTNLRNAQKTWPSYVEGSLFAPIKIFYDAAMKTAFKRGTAPVKEDEEEQAEEQEEEKEKEEEGKEEEQEEE